MKQILLLISFLFCIVIFAEARSGFDPPEGKVCVVDIADDFSDISMASIEVDLTVELKMLDVGRAVVAEGTSPPSNKSPMLFENNKLKFAKNSNLVIKADNETPKELLRKTSSCSNELGLSSGGTSGEQVFL